MRLSRLRAQAARPWSYVVTHIVPPWLRQLLSVAVRFALPTVVVMAIGAYLVIPLVTSAMWQWMLHDLDNRSTVVADALEQPIAVLANEGAYSRIESLFVSATRDARLDGVALCSGAGQVLVETGGLPGNICDHAGPAEPRSLWQTVRDLGGIGALQLPSRHVAFAPLRYADSDEGGRLAFAYSLEFAQRRVHDLQLYVVIVMAALGGALALVSMTMAHLSWRGWIKAMRGVLLSPAQVAGRVAPPTDHGVQPLIGDLKNMVSQLERERRVREEQTVAWTPETLRRWLRDTLRDEQVIVLANREPYIHNKTADGGISLQRPASGLVTAIEPVMRACSGTWIAHGSGTADRETSDARGRLQVPPNAPPNTPGYTLRRIWLSKEEEDGYYYGFANEGFWPLCHIAHVRPVFRRKDWEQYQRVNRRFADAVVEEARSDDPVVLVQDYHFALAPQYIRERLPNATILTFWHIPWPNAEAFGVCPWRDELLNGLLGSTILGFHTSYHVNNFLQTVDRYLETRIESDQATIHHHGGQLTRVQPYPISIAWPTPETTAQLPPVDECRRQVRDELRVPHDHLLAVGIDRLDYTKGILERFAAVEALLELEPSLVGHFTLLQIAAPTRSSLPEYAHFAQAVRNEAERINAEFATGQHPAIVLRTENHNALQVQTLYRAAELCLVTSLHDGMNLVAKEFIGAREDEQGVLILSQFTGAARELLDALIVNPYDIEATALALRQGLLMPQAEQRERMRFMRSMVREYNIYRWAGRMLMDAAQVRQRTRLQQRLHEARSNGWHEEIT